ncbi:hypothetical protein IKW72_02340 [bacterium]|nr:hypothetical protein [bacterium]
MKIIKRLFWAAVILIALLVVAFFVVTSSPFITKVLVPALQTEEYMFTLDDIDLGFGESSFSNLNFVWKNPSGETNMTLFVQNFKTGYELISLGSDQTKIKVLSITGPRLAIFPPFFEKKEKQPEEKKEKEDFDLKKKIEELKIPVDLDALHVPGASFSVTTKEEKLWGSLNLEVNKFAPNKEADLKVTGNARYVKGEDVTVERMPFSMEAAFTFADSLIPTGAKGSLLITNLTGRAGEIDLANWYVLGNLQAECESVGQALIIKNLSLALKQGKKDVAGLVSNGRYDVASGSAEAAAALQVMPSLLWEKLFGDRVPLALGQLETSLTTKARWDNSAATLSGNNHIFLKKVAYSAYPHLPPLDCELVSTTRFETANKKISFDRFDLSARRPDGSVMLLVKTLSPLALEFDKLSRGELCSANIAYELRDAELQWLSPFVKGSDVTINKGTVSVVGKTAFDPEKKDLSGVWQLSLNDADVAMKEKRYRKLNGEALLEGSFSDNDRFLFTLKRFSATLNNKNVLSAGAKGEGSISKKSYAARWDIGSLSSLLWDPGNVDDQLFLQSAGSANASLPKVTLNSTSLAIQKGRNQKQSLDLSGEFYIEPTAGKQKLLVSSDHFDIGALTASDKDKEKQDKQEKQEAPKKSGSSEPAKDIEKWQAEATLDFKELCYGNYVISPCKLFVELMNGVATLKGPNLGFAEGTLDLKSVCDLKVPGYAYNLSLLGTNISCMAVSKAAMPKGDTYISGLAGLNLQAQGQGTDSEAIKKDLTAQFKMDVRDGELKNIKVLNSLASVLHYSRLSDLPFRDFDMQASLTNGLLTIEKSEVQSTVVGLRTEGTIDMDKNIDMAISLTLTAQAVKEIILSLAPKSTITDDDEPGKSYPLPPIVVTGTLEDPKILGPENVFKSLTKTLGAHWEMFLDVVPTDKVKEGVQKGIEKLSGVIQGGDKNSDASQKADKIIQDGKNLLKGLFKSK